MVRDFPRCKDQDNCDFLHGRKLSKDGKQMRCKFYHTADEKKKAEKKNPTSGGAANATTTQTKKVYVQRKNKQGKAYITVENLVVIGE